MENVNVCVCLVPNASTKMQISIVVYIWSTVSAKYSLLLYICIYMSYSIYGIYGLQYPIIYGIQSYMVYMVYMVESYI
jgi:hypothetical protein